MRGAAPLPGNFRRLINNATEPQPEPHHVRDDVARILRPELAPTGAGEATCRVIPALANAFFDATGVRLRRARMTPENVKKALARA